MKFEDIPADILTIRIRQTKSSAAELQEQPVFSVEASQKRPDEFVIRLENSVLDVRPVVVKDIRRLNSELASGHAMLAQLANPAADGSIELQIAFFTGECLEMGEIEIGVDEYVENAMAKVERQKAGFKVERLYQRLGQLCSFRQAGSDYFLLSAGPAIDAALKPESGAQNCAQELPDKGHDTEDSESEAKAEQGTVADDERQQSKPVPNRENSFCVTGDSLRFVATETTLPDGQSIFTVTRLTKVRNEADRSLRLAKGKLVFRDWTKAGRIQILAKAQLSALTKDDGSYLKKWDEFGDFEGEILLKRAREVGALQYCDMQQNRAGDGGKATVSVRITQASDTALNALVTGGVPEVELVDELPDYLKNDSLTFKEFVGAIEKEAGQGKIHGKTAKSQEKRPYFKLANFDPTSRTMTLEAEALPKNSGAFILSLAGEIAQIKRRMAARRLILEGRAANPQLGLLIEEAGQFEPTRLLQKVRPLTAFVREKIFRNPPTLMQEKAIEVALNTPDIALIQGPPGTGKTTVIAAILERLNELADKRGASTKGTVLLTGFQHDAVQNMIERLSLNGIPVPKFGKRSGSYDDFDAFERSLEGWCRALAAELRERNPDIAKIEREDEIKKLCLQYIEAPTRTLAANLAIKVASLGVSILGEHGARRAANLAKNLSREELLNDESDQLLDAVRRLRTRSECFSDDGPERATDALAYLRDFLEESERALLDKASLWRGEDGDPHFLQDLANLKKKLLIRISAPPVFRVEKQNQEVIALAEEAIACIRARGFSTKDAKSAALAEFLAELESNPYGMVEAITDYSFAFAATCQQSVNKTMQIQKGIIGNDADQAMEYEFVIVDEAARVSPRDLMIPMAQGKRIILVGDHRQLPHIIDDEVARQMEEGETGEEESEWLKKSMFQYLFSERLKALEDNDGITRRVTLDKQYRMHPLLGDFISRNFYERFDSLEKFGSGRPETEFVHNLPGTDNSPAIWLEVPAENGRQQRSGTSWTRPVEATAIARQLQAWMNSDAGKDMSFGVISFYKAQAELIRKQLGNITADDKKLRIGTVDSFQGMEFDVVFLSMVRTLPKSWTTEDSSREKQARQLFGHLCLYNRLNVSMSRQKKLLVVAGDSGLLQNELADEFIPGLVDFLQLCKREGRVL